MTAAHPAVAPRFDRVGWTALLVGSAIIAWSGVLARWLDVGPLAGAAWLGWRSRFARLALISAPVAAALFLRVQSPYPHHLYLLAPFVALFVAAPLLRLYGRSRALGLAALAAGFAFGATGSLATLTVVSLCAYVAFFAIGLGPIFWLLIAEIFPLRVRGRAMSLATIANWGFNLLVTVSFLGLVNALGRPGAFGLYLILTLVALAFSWKLAPETKGRSLEEIETALDGEAAPRAEAMIRTRREHRESA